MAHDFRFYSLSLLLVFLLWTAPARADIGDYAGGSGCPNIAVPVDFGENPAFGGEDFGRDDLRELYPYDADAYINDYEEGNFDTCNLFIGSGTYYDTGHRLWTLDDDLDCSYDSSGYGDFRAGEDY